MMLKLVKNFFKYTAIIAFVLFILLFLPILLICRKYLQAKILKGRKKRLWNGINILEPIEIGGIKQWVSVRGESKENPILLVLHGGPGASMMPYSFIFDPLETNFTIVQWDQRGVGKTYAANKKATMLETITIKQMQADTLELVNYLCRRFKKEKIFVLGHSWGSFLGLTLAHDHPGLVYAYIGVGQFINVKMNEKIGFDHALKSAYEKNNKKAIKALEKLSSINTNFTMKDLLILRKWQFHLNGFLINKFALFAIIVKALSSPEYTLLDYISLVRGITCLSKSKNLYDEIMNIALEEKNNFFTSIYIFAGKKDPITPSLPVYDYFKKINAPYKEYIWFENSGHNLFFEEKNKFVECLSAIKN